MRGGFRSAAACCCTTVATRRRAVDKVEHELVGTWASMLNRSRALARKSARLAVTITCAPHRDGGGEPVPVADVRERKGVDERLVAGH